MSDTLVVHVTRPVHRVQLGAVPVDTGGASLGTDLTAIEALTGTGVARRTGDGVWTLDSTGATGLALLSAESASAARTTLELGDSATKNVGTTAGTVAAGDHAHGGVYQPAVTQQTLTDAPTITCNWSNGLVATVTLGGNRTIAMSGGSDGDLCYLHIVQDGTGDRSLEYGSEVPVRPEHRRQPGQETVHVFRKRGSSYHLVGPSPWIWLPCTSDTSHSTAATWAVVAGTSWTPVPGAIYEMAARLTGYSAALTTGIAGRFTTGGATIGGGALLTQATSIGTTTVRYQGAPDTAGVTGGSVSSTSTARTSLWGHMVFQAASPSPTACSVDLTTEVDGSAVTAAAGVSGMYIRRLA